MPSQTKFSFSTITPFSVFARLDDNTAYPRYIRITPSIREKIHGLDVDLDDANATLALTRATVKRELRLTPIVFRNSSSIDIFQNHWREQRSGSSVACDRIVVASSRRKTRNERGLRGSLIADRKTKKKRKENGTEGTRRRGSSTKFERNSNEGRKKSSRGFFSADETTRGTGRAFKKKAFLSFSRLLGWSRR